MFVSVIITTKNEGKNIEHCLKSIECQDFSRGGTEIIVVDNNSHDRTKEIARKYTEKVFDRGPERSAQRNFGVGKAEGKYILYLDADMTLSRNVVSECVNMLNGNEDIAALYIPEVIRGKGFWGKVRNFERSFYDGTIIDAVRFIRKNIFLEVGGFDENLTGPEDWDFDKKIRRVGKVGLVKTKIYHNEQSFRLKKYLERKKYYARDFEKYIAKWGKNDPDIRRQFGFWYRFVGVFTEQGKWKKMIRHPILVAGMLVLRFFVGFNFVTKRNP